MRLTNRTKHEKLVGSEWWKKNECSGPHIVAFLAEGSLYLIVNIEEGNISFKGYFNDLIKELKNNYHE